MVVGMDRPEHLSRQLAAAASAAAAAMWLHQGLWCKVLGRDPAHRAVLGSVPGMPARLARPATVALGVAETVLAAVVMRRGDRRSVAATQTGAVVAFNAGGLLVGRDHIAHPLRMVVRNAAFLGLVWAPVVGRRAR